MPSATTTASSSRTCKGVTQAGRPCRRPAAGSRYCTQHATQAPSADDARVVADPAVPADIDRKALADVLSDLGTSRGFPDGERLAAAQAAADDDAGGFTGGTMDEFAHAARAFSGVLSRARDAAVAQGAADGNKWERFLHDVGAAVTSLLAGIAERMSGDYEEDDFGFDERFTESLVPLVGLLYEYYWRVDVEGIENVPAEGRALLVSNHAGAGIPLDGAMIKYALFKHHPQHRHARMLVLDWLMGLPWMADFAKKTGQQLACTPNAVDMLERDLLVGVFPEGAKGMAKNFSQRYSLERFGRGGFVRIALRTGSPIIPVAVVGSEEIYPKMGSLPFINKLIGAPFVPMTPTFPWFGLLGLVPLPSKWHIEFCEPIEVAQYGPQAADDRQFVLELSERVRATIQKRLRANLLKRSTPFW